MWPEMELRCIIGTSNWTWYVLTGERIYQKKNTPFHINSTVIFEGLSPAIEMAQQLRVGSLTDPTLIVLFVHFLLFVLVAHAGDQVCNPPSLRPHLGRTLLKSLVLPRFSDTDVWWKRSVKFLQRLDHAFDL